MTDEEIKPNETIEQPESTATAGESSDNNRPDDFNRLSNTDAIKKAVQVHRERDATNSEPEKPSETPSKAEVKQDLADELEPPSGFNKQEKEAWKAKDLPSIMKAYRRLESSRVQEVSRAQAAERQAREEAKQWLELNPIAEPYVNARAKEGITRHQAIKEALDVVSALRSAKPAEVKQALANAKINLDDIQENSAAPDISPLQEDVSALKLYIQRQELQKAADNYDSTFKELGSLKNRTGEPCFPEFNFQEGDEAGNELARAIGSSTKDPAFIAGVKRRIPDADFKTIVLEAYKYHGGKVSGQPVAVSQEQNQKHIERARRAASSTPARQASRNDRSNLIGKLSPKAAIRQALIDHRGN